MRADVRACVPRLPQAGRRMSVDNMSYDSPRIRDATLDDGLGQPKYTVCGNCRHALCVDCLEQVAVVVDAHSQRVVAHDVFHALMSAVNVEQLLNNPLKQRAEDVSHLPMPRPSKLEHPLNIDAIVATAEVSHAPMS